MRRLTGATLGLMMGLIALAAFPTGATADLTTVTEVNAYGTAIGARFDAAQYQSNNCGGSTYKVAGENPTAIERARLVMLITALVSGKQVWITAGGCDGSMEQIVFVGLYE